MAIPFLVNDGTSDIAIDPKDADISNLKYNYEKVIGGWTLKKDRKALPKEITRFCTLNGISTKGFLGEDKVIRFNETCLIPNEEIYALGRVNKVSNRSKISNLLKIKDNSLIKAIFTSL